jgi:hypothetical protein
MGSALIGDVKQPIIRYTKMGRKESVNTFKSCRIWQLSRSFKRWFEAWKKKAAKKSILSTEYAEEFAKKLSWRKQVIDIRKDSEYSAEHVEDAFKPAML